MPGCSWRGHLRGVHIHYCPGVLGGDTCEGYIFITARVFLEGTPAMGTYGFHYCPGVLGGDTYDGYIVHQFHELREELIRASRLKKVMVDKGKKSRKFLDDLHNNAFSGTNRKDAVEHIEYYLKIIDPSKLPNVDHDKLRVVVFTILLAGGARRCSREDGYCNGGNFPGAYHIGNSLHYQDLEWYEALEDIELKDEALRNKSIIEGLISNDESGNDYWRRWKSHEIYYHNYDERECENKTHEEGHELCSIKTQEVLVCQIKRYKMIKYLFNNEEEYVAVKEDEYKDLTITSEEACRAYQKIFRMMDEGWMVTRTE
ncbi:hypothetical protein Tco_0857835 [Tanacetum coccineum]|uniref:Uncharacterized protein n=1 Tax=Tanacetum coccineum TaxID=301880 RepID=A0ABQ5B8F3_9ASTR